MSIKLYSYCNQRCLWHVCSIHFQIFVCKQCRKFIFVRLFIHIVNIFFGKKALSFLWFFYQKNNISLVYRKKAIFLSDTHFLSWGEKSVLFRANLVEIDLNWFYISSHVVFQYFFVLRVTPPPFSSSFKIVDCNHYFKNVFKRTFFLKSNRFSSRKKGGFKPAKAIKYVCRPLAYLHYRKWAKKYEKCPLQFCKEYEIRW